MKSAKWVLIVLISFACLSAKNLRNKNNDVSVSKYTLITKEQEIILPEVVIHNTHCSDEMVEINSEYCPYVKEECLNWIDSEKENPMMCAKFAYPTKCISKPTRLNFCIDKYEAQDEPGQIPEVFIDWYTAKDKCESVGKRLCDVRELTLACEGPERKPYPYGYKRDINKCNIGHQWIDPDNTPFFLVDKRAPSGSYETCKSDFGVYDIVGNVDELSINSEGSLTKSPFKSALFGGHYVNGVRNRCRDKGTPSITVSHGPTAKNYEISYRCCADVT
jgi:formylglycine-generating enzyme required for sulfatase activity